MIKEQLILKNDLIFHKTFFSVIRSSHVRTPIQDFGLEYIKRQKASGRPLSPHLGIYKKQLTWMLSGLYRISGCVMGGSKF